MQSSYDVIIAGAGPAGLACARVCAEGGARVAVFERKSHIGTKVCAGGITWNGLLQRFGDISQRRFSEQRIVTRKQRAQLQEKNPIIATVNRKELGELMADQAREAGAEIYTDCQILRIDNGEILIKDNSDQEKHKRFQYGTLVGADGSNSMVRRYLALPCVHQGIGINYQLNIVREEMEWHLDPTRFASGYAWIFPHQTTTSVGAYVDMKVLSAPQLKNALTQWAKENGLELAGTKLGAETINFDYRGVEFHREQKIFLVGDAAGLASGLTGEGIYPAIVSGEYVGQRIGNASWQSAEFTRLEKNHARHKKAVLYARNHPNRLAILSELCCLLLRWGIISCNSAEMAHQ